MASRDSEGSRASTRRDVGLGLRRTFGGLELGGGGKKFEGGLMEV